MLGPQLLVDAKVHLQMHKSVLCAIFVHYLVFIEHVFTTLFSASSQIKQDNAQKWHIRQTCASADKLVHQPKVEF